MKDSRETEKRERKEKIDEPQFIESWDIKRVIIALLFLGIMGWLGHTFFTQTNNMALILGVSDKNEYKKPTPTPTYSPLSNEELQVRLEGLKEEVNKLDVADMVASSPQVDKIFKDLESLRDLPHNQMKEACYNICKGL